MRFEATLWILALALVQWLHLPTSFAIGPDEVPLPRVKGPLCQLVFSPSTGAYTTEPVELRADNQKEFSAAVQEVRIALNYRRPLTVQQNAFLIAALMRRFGNNLPRDPAYSEMADSVFNKLISNLPLSREEVDFVNARLPEIRAFESNPNTIATYLENVEMERILDLSFDLEFVTQMRDKLKSDKLNPAEFNHQEKLWLKRLIVLIPRPGQDMSVYDYWWKDVTNRLMDNNTILQKDLVILLQQPQFVALEGDPKTYPDRFKAERDRRSPIR